MYTIKCKTSKGELLVINELEFVKKIKNNEETMKIIENSCI